MRCSERSTSAGRVKSLDSESVPSLLLRLCFSCNRPTVVYTCVYSNFIKTRFIEVFAYCNSVTGARFLVLLRILYMLCYHCLAYHRLRMYIGTCYLRCLFVARRVSFSILNFEKVICWCLYSLPQDNNRCSIAYSDY